MIPSRIQRLQSILACPDCSGTLYFSSELARCNRCCKEYGIRNDKIYFTPGPSRTDEFDILKGWLKKWLGSYYHTIGIHVFAPTYPFRYAKWVRRYLNPAEQVVIDIGCGNHRIDPNVIGIDFFDYDAVDMVCDLNALPLKAGSVDAFISRSVLEHLPDTRAVVRRLYRCTKPGGLGLHLAPFLFPFHASPNDFRRYTHKGYARLFENWEVLRQINATGPVTLFLICLIEFLSVLLSGGQHRLKSFVYVLLCGLLFPLKFFDAAFVNRSAFLTMAPTIFTVVRKPPNEAS